MKLRIGWHVIRLTSTGCSFPSSSSFSFFCLIMFPFSPLNHHHYQRHSHQHPAHLSLIFTFRSPYPLPSFSESPSFVSLFSFFLNLSPFSQVLRVARWPAFSSWIPCSRTSHSSKFMLLTLCFALIVLCYHVLLFIRLRVTFPVPGV
jgi:hypothetical protein